MRKLLKGEAVPVGERELDLLSFLLKTYPRVRELLRTDGRDLLIESPVDCEVRIDDELKPDQIRAAFHAVLLRRCGTDRTAVRDLVATDDPQSNLVADDLDTWIRSWLNQRLWSLNRVPEMVAHDERHVSSVEDILASLIRQSGMRENGTLTTRQVQWLSVSAWLHDWGHVGGVPCRSGLTGAPLPTGAIEVRDFHGLISEALLGPEWSGMHGLDPVVAEPAGLLCAHHQGWTSFGRRRPNSERATSLQAKFGVEPLSLSEHVEVIRRNVPGARQDLQLSKVQLMVALLRVADGLDLGLHRVGDRGASRDAFLALCLYQEALRAVDMLGAQDRDRDTARSIADLALGAALNGQQQVAPELLQRLPRPYSPVVRRLVAYAGYVNAQNDYFTKHATVRAVWAERQGADGPIDLVVFPASSDSAEAAVAAVKEDLKREIDAENGAVRQVLNLNGIRFGSVRSFLDAGNSVEVDV